MADDAPPLRSYALPSSPCRSPTGADAMSVWVEAASDGEPRVRVALTDEIARSPRRLPPSPSSSSTAPAVDSAAPPLVAPEPAAAAHGVDFPLVLVGESRAMVAHSTAMSAAIVPFQKLQMDTNLHQTTLPAPQTPAAAVSSPRAAAEAFGSAFHGADAMSQNFMEAMRLGDIVARPQEPQLSVRLRGGRVELASGSDDDAVDFLGPAENIKKLFKLPYSQGPVSLAVHRVGSTLVVDGGIDDVDLPPGFADDDDAQSPSTPAVHTQPKSIEDEKEREDEQSQQILYEKFIYQSTVAGRLLANEGKTTSPAAVDEQPPSQIASKTKSRGRRSGGGKTTKHARPAPGSGASSAATSSSAAPFSFETDHRNHHAPSSTSASNSASGNLPAFQRVLKWKFNDLKMVLGSDVMLFSNPEHPAVSLRLHDMDKELSLATVLDYYLDNVIANIPELAICMHSKGVVRGYKLVETRQIPYMSGDTSRPLFDVQEVSLNASMLLKFLKNNCTRPNGTYWLHRKHGENALRLYDVNVLSQGKQLKWKYMMAMLCYRFASRASRMMYSLTADTPRLRKQLRLRQRDLLRTCVNLLKEIAAAGGAAHNSIRSSVAEQLADTYIREEDDEEDNVEHEPSETEEGSKASAKATALVQAKTYLRESIQLFEECIRAEIEASALPTAEGTPLDENEEAVETAGGHDGEMDAFMKEELERLQMKCGSVSLQLARLRFQEENWASSIICIRDALVYVPGVSIPSCSTTLSDRWDIERSEIDELLGKIDFDGVRQKDDPFYGGATRDADARVCTTGAELRCFVLEVIGDAASKQPSEATVAKELLELYWGASGEDPSVEGAVSHVGTLPHPLLLRQLAFSAYLRALFPAVDSELYFRLMKKLGNACNELGKYYLSTTPNHAAAFRWFERGCRVFRDIEDSVNVALLSANLAHLHKILAQREANDFSRQQQHYERAVQLCLDAASLLKHHKLDTDAILYRKVTGELALGYLVWGVALANSSEPHRASRDTEAQKKFSKALALYTEINDVKQVAATHYQIASYHARQISRDVSNQKANSQDSTSQKHNSGLKSRMEITRRHYEKALEYFGRVELGATFVLIHQELADLYALGGRIDDLDHALLVLLNTVHAFQSAGPVVQPLSRGVMTKIQATVHQLIRVSATAASATGVKRTASSASKDDSKVLPMIDTYKQMYKEVLYFNAATSATSADAINISPTLVTLQSIYDEASTS